MTNPFIIDKSNIEHAKLRKRHRKELRFQIYGAISIMIAFIFLFVLLFSIFKEGSTAFIKTQIKLEVELSESIIDPSGGRNSDVLHSANYSKIIRNSLIKLFPEAKGRKAKRRLYSLISKGAAYDLRDMIERDLSLIGTTQEVWFTASSDIDMFIKGRISADVDSSLRRVKDNQIAWIGHLKDNGALRTSFNTNFFTKADSREPEQAGILGSMIGSFFVIMVCILIALPIGVGAAIYLEEFAKKNRLNDIIEVSINNLAAVPSIVYGLLALAIFLGFFGMERSAPLVGGLALSLLVLPTIVITTRNSLAAVPPSIKDAAIGLGASPMQVMLHHTLPLAMPGVMTGAILSIARAIGETAPLLMIGMVAFVADIPASINDPATALPVQIYLWADSPELGFKEKTSAAIMILLGFLIIANTLAVILRNKFEKKW